MNTGRGQELYRKGQQFAKGTRRGQTPIFVKPCGARVYLQRGQRGQNVI